MTKNKQRYRWRLLACSIVIIIVLALVIAAAILLTGSPNSTASKRNGAPGISLEEWLSGSLSPKSFNGTWISGFAVEFRPPFIRRQEIFIARSQLPKTVSSYVLGPLQDRESGDSNGESIVGE
ncbi:uncharacterized protein LOC105424473 isoform X2 [Pogonomyrmex barbatus]|uniref:Uncharacterized protein LOC105424473 isoform X2 n=1 Tax=Pogonomyrmex barbatus TaxID=144034 RepID=A0A6I9W072_9HYME|nr:uncharacterized protein LOC105424473 isoform X2 [Pogonomyrmex barbatus]